MPKHLLLICMQIFFFLRINQLRLVTGVNQSAPDKVRLILYFLFVVTRRHGCQRAVLNRQSCGELFGNFDQQQTQQEKQDWEHHYHSERIQVRAADHTRLCAVNGTHDGHGKTNTFYSNVQVR